MTRLCWLLLLSYNRRELCKFSLWSTYWPYHWLLHVEFVNDTGDNGAKTLRELQVEDDEERFQADLEKAVRQSLGKFISS